MMNEYVNTIVKLTRFEINNTGYLDSFLYALLFFIIMHYFKLTIFPMKLIYLFCH
jgi:hypothetical protein